MSTFFKELKRRNVIKATISYIVVAWVILQAAAIVFPILFLEEGAMRILLIALLIGFPVWVVFAYIFELTPSGFRKTSDVAPEKSTYKATGKRLNAFIIGGLSLAVVLLLADRIFDVTGVRAIGALDKSIAVLPFSNMSNDPDQEYFSDGLTDDILTQLAKIEGFKVISRTSVMQYKENPPPIKQIAEELEVALILEGSVQKAGNQLRITAQLINAYTDEHIWADSYDRPIDDLFSIQREVATAIARVLRTKLSPVETARLEETPTENIEAYQLYQQGKYYLDQAHFNADGWLGSVKYFEEAVKLDPQFAEAFALMTKVHSRLYYLRVDRTAERLELARENADKAQAIDAENPNVQLAMGYYYLWAKADKTTALTYFEKASDQLPNSIPVIKAMASIYETQGRYDDYIELYLKAVDISPLDASCWTNLTFGYQFTYQFKKGFETIAKANALNPEQNWNHFSKAFMMWSYNGADDGSREALERVDKDHSWYLWSIFHQEMFERNFDALEQLIELYPEGVNHKMNRMPQPLLKAYLLQFLGDTAAAQLEFERSAAILEAEIIDHEDDDRLYSALGISYAGLGKREEAIAAGKRAIEILPTEKDHLYGQPAELDMALTYTLLGEYDLAFDHLENVLSAYSYWSTKWLEGDLRYAALKEQPRFNELIAKYEKEFQ